MKPVLVLDLDETLIYSRKPGKIRIRPFTRDFIEKMSKYYTLVVFTAGSLNYAKRVLQVIDLKKLVTQIYSNQDLEFIYCNSQVIGYYKDLTRVRPCLKRLVMIENSKSSFKLDQQDNGIVLPDYTGSFKDRELEKLAPKLVKLSKYKEFTKCIKDFDFDF
jgi:CTD small phosphatase-like protein 2